MEKHKKESEFDNETFFEEYAKMARSVDGLNGAAQLTGKGDEQQILFL